MMAYIYIQLIDQNSISAVIHSMTGYAAIALPDRCYVWHLQNVHHVLNKNDSHLDRNHCLANIQNFVCLTRINLDMH